MDKVNHDVDNITRSITQTGSPDAWAQKVAQIVAKVCAAVSDDDAELFHSRLQVRLAVMRGAYEFGSLEHVLAMEEYGQEAW